MSCCDHFIENFKSILNADLLESVYSKYRLIEKSNKDNGKAYSMEIMANITNVSFTLDKRIVDSNNNEINVLGFLNRRREGLNKKNDLIVICPVDDDGKLELTVFLIEMKSNNTKGALKQILCGMLFVDYLIDIYKLHFDLTFEVVLKYYGIIASSSAQGVKQSSTNKNTTYPFRKVGSNGFDIHLLSWNCNSRLPLRDIHSKL